MTTTPAIIALAALLAAFTIPTLFRFAREIGEPADEPCSDFTEPRRPCPFGCGCRGHDFTNGRN